jgi:hypothetical protein
MNPVKRTIPMNIPTRLCLLFLLLTPASSLATIAQSTPDLGNTFRWIHQDSDPQLWQQIEYAFREELAPDQPKADDNPMDVYQYKFFQKIGVVNHSALVIIGHRQTKELTRLTAYSQYWSALNFDLTSHQKTRIEHTEVMYGWKLLKLAKFGPSSIPDVTFAYETCTECDGVSLFFSLYFQQEKSGWALRPWASTTSSLLPPDNGLVINAPPDDEGILSSDCIFRILDARDNGFQKVAIRCKEVDETPHGRAKITDDTVLYSLSDGQFKPRRITDTSEIVALNAEMCRTNSRSPLCRLPAYMTITDEQSALIDEMFPKAPKTARDLAHFRRLEQTTAMSDIVSRCGKPDELGGSGIAIFIYHLKDGSIVAIGATGSAQPILYANHITTNGNSSSLLTTK